MTTSKLDRLLHALSSDERAKHVHLPLYAAAARIRLPENRCRDYYDFTRFIIRAMQVFFAASVNADVLLPESEALARGRDILQYAYEQEGGYEAAAMEAMLANNGGPQAILHHLHEGVRQQADRRYMDYHIGQVINPMSYDQSVEFANEVLGRYGHLLPSELRRKSPAEIAVNYKFLVRMLVNISDQLRRRLGKYDN